MWAARAQCCTCNFCGCGEIFEFIFAGLGTAWWAVASVVLMQKSFAANNANIPVRTCGVHPDCQTAGIISYNGVEDYFNCLTWRTDACTHFLNLKYEELSLCCKSLHVDTYCSHPPG